MCRLVLAVDDLFQLEVNLFTICITHLVYQLEVRKASQIAEYAIRFRHLMISYVRTVVPCLGPTASEPMLSLVTDRLSPEDQKVLVSSNAPTCLSLDSTRA